MGSTAKVETKPEVNLPAGWHPIALAYCCFRTREICSMISSTRDVLTTPPPPSRIQLRQIAGGDQRSCRELIDAWEPAITVLAARCASRSSDLDDLIQVGRIAVYHCALYFNGSLGVPFGHYTKRGIKNRVRKEAHRLARQRRFDGPLESNVADEQDLSDDRGSVDAVKRWVQELPEPHATTFRLLYVESMTQRSAARQMGVSQPRVAQLHRSFLCFARGAFIN
jgi:RNA polymerase sigma factor (sigma-70 family)